MTAQVKKLKVGDVIRVHNPLFPPEGRLYTVLEVEGNRAYTKFRTFHAKI
jgi:hypothetical protein